VTQAHTRARDLRVRRPGARITRTTHTRDLRVRRARTHTPASSLARRATLDFFRVPTKFKLGSIIYNYFSFHYWTLSTNAVSLCTPRRHIGAGRNPQREAPMSGTRLPAKTRTARAQRRNWGDRLPQTRIYARNNAQARARIEKRTRDSSACVFSCEFCFTTGVITHELLRIPGA
jgi:hypothetical protein